MLQAVCHSLRTPWLAWANSFRQLAHCFLQYNFHSLPLALFAGTCTGTTWWATTLFSTAAVVVVGVGR